jgi:hypothetical protein
MKKILSIKPMEDYKLLCSFSDGTVKVADIIPYLQDEAFKPLLNPAAFSKIENRDYYAEWPQYELDLSADTLWHIGIDVVPVNS